MTLLNDTKRAQKFTRVFHLTASVVSKIVENTATNGQGGIWSACYILESYYLVCDNTLALLVLNLPSATNRTGDPNKFNERQRYLANSVFICLFFHIPSRVYSTIKECMPLNMDPIEGYYNHILGFLTFRLSHHQRTSQKSDKRPCYLSHEDDISSQFKMTESFDKILMTLSAAVVYAPDNTPMFREIAYAGIPQCKINEEHCQIQH